jgi:V8-like Glu-specific endopeptidase
MKFKHFIIFQFKFFHIEFCLLLLLKGETCMTRCVLLFILTFICGHASEKYNSAFIILVTKTNSFTYVCSAVAVNKKTLLTAAHCLDNAEKVKVLKDKEITFPYADYKVLNFAKHSDYDQEQSNFLYDIGKINLVDELDSKVNILSVSDLKMQGELTRVGFGLRNYDNVMNVFTQINDFNDYGQYFSAYDEQSYSGDSGGPIYQEYEGTTYLVGIHSTLEGHGNTLNVKINFFNSWLKP